MHGTSPLRGAARDLGVMRYTGRYFQSKCFTQKLPRMWLLGRAGFVFNLVFESGCVVESVTNLFTLPATCPSACSSKVRLALCQSRAIGWGLSSVARFSAWQAEAIGLGLFPLTNVQVTESGIDGPYR